MAEMQTMSDKLKLRIERQAKQLEDKYFREWRDSKTVEERETIHSKLKVLADLKFSLINSINEVD